jgi:MYXO-CTERM domain-containing protein
MPGPYFFVRNVASGDWGDAGFKLNTAGNSAVPSRHVYVYQNTFVRSTKGPLLHLWYAVEGDHNVPIHDVVFRNNIFSAPMGGECTDAYNHGTEQPSFDGNVWWTTDTTQIFSWWNGATTDHYDTFAAFQTGASQEAHGAFGEPGLGSNFVPTMGALVVDRAIPIPGINDHFVGAAPDVGAYELGGSGPIPVDDGGIPMPVDDGGVVTDAGLGPDGGTSSSSNSGGCGCVLSGRDSSPWTMAPFGLLALAILVRRTAIRRR